jgi:excinuclease ABC subunit A
MNQVLVYTKEIMKNHSLEQLRDIGNSVIVVEHDKDMIERADYVIDIGPKAGKYGGEIHQRNTPEILKHHTITAMYMNGEMKLRFLQNAVKEMENS